MKVDNETVKYFLSLAVKGVLEKVLMWNLPPTLDSSKVFYSLEIDVMIMKIFTRI